MTERTPTPYRLEWEEEFDTFHHGVIGRYPAGVKGANNCWVVRFDDDYGTDQALDGEFIVRACNSHEELLAACQAAYDYVTRDKTLTEFHSGLQLYAQLRGAMEKARGEA